MSKPATTKPSEHAFPPFHQSLPMRLLRARDATMLHFRPILAEYKLTEQQWRVIRALRDAGELEISPLARICHVMLPSMSGILKRLELRGLTRRSGSAHDQRRSLISLTKRGEALIRDVSPKLKVCYRAVEARLGAQKLQELYRLLDEVAQELSE